MENIELNHLLNQPLLELITAANNVRKELVGSKFELCSIVNAKSGLCSEDCKFCAQSSQHATKIPKYQLKSKTEIIKEAQDAKDIGAERFGIVTSGKSLKKDELDRVKETVSEIKEKIGIEVCASLGKLDEVDLLELKQAGLSRYHHNIETSPEFFPKIVSTHKFQEKVDTLKAAKRVGLEVCSGGIIGMGESWQDRIKMALLLRELDVDSVPINLLVPIEGTPLESVKPISCHDAVRTICIFRTVLKDKMIKIAAGRETILKDFQALSFLAGANGMLIGGYLTIRGRGVEEDWRLVKELKKLWTG